MPSSAVVRRWAALDLDKPTELLSRKVVSGERQLLAQVYLKRGAHVPVRRHESEQLQYVLEGALRCRVGGEEIVVREGEVLVIPAGVPHQAEALADTFALGVRAVERGGLPRDGSGAGRSREAAVGGLGVRPGQCTRSSHLPPPPRG